jgi:protein-glutamine gamma-glutamyltransferase
MTLWQRFVEVNRPGPPEHSVSFRAASAAAVLVAVGACWSEDLLSPTVAVFAVVATVVGNAVSYLHRARPWPGVKPVLAACAVGGFVWFILTVTRTATPGDVSTVEGPLAVLFAWVLSTHAFDVPSRRDVTYSLAGSTALVAVAAAQSVDLGLGMWVLAWVVCCVWGLVAMWQSVSETAGLPWRPLLAAGVLVALVAVLVVAVLPAPKVSTSLVFASAPGASSTVDSPTNLTDGGSSLPAHAASPRGRTAVGGFLGFAKSLDTADRVALGNQVIMRVRATRPNYWVGQTFDDWNGQSWVQAADPVNGQRTQKQTGGSPFTIPTYPDQVADQSSGAEDIQTFYLTTGGPNLVFHADNAQRVYLRARAIYVTADGTIASTESMGAGTIYTVVSNDTTATAAELQAATAPVSRPEPASPLLGPAMLGPGEEDRYLQLPHSYPRVAALATSITNGIGSTGGTDPHTYDKVAAIEHWMSSHVRYTTDIPPLPAGADAVDSFLFQSRRGYCEQISTATVVMLRSLGIPAREAVGYVPGTYNPITDLYDVQAKDAHAWVQVWFPGYGWQNFDPTATVPLANPTPGSVLARSIGGTLARLPWLPLSLTGIVAAAVVGLRRRNRRRPPTWAHQVAADLARGGARIGCVRRSHETLSAYGQRLALCSPEHATDIGAVTGIVERATYGGFEPSADELRWALDVSRRFRSIQRGPRGRRTGGGPGGSPGPGGSGGPDGPGPSGGPGREGSGLGAQDLAWASASSNEAPAASSGR